jgi:uncharacterized membrane protein
MINGSNWMIGPQLIGILLAAIGAIQYFLPPKRMNNYYGYRMPSAWKSQETWDEANRYSAVCMIKCGVVVIISGLIITSIFRTVSMPSNIRDGLTAFSFIVSGMAPVLVMIVATEKHLSKKFDQE